MSRLHAVVRAEPARLKAIMVVAGLGHLFAKIGDDNVIFGDTEGDWAGIGSTLDSTIQRTSVFNFTSKR